VSVKVNVIAAALVRSAVSPNTSLPLEVHVPVLLTAGVLIATRGRLLLLAVVLPKKPVRVMYGRPPGLSAAVALQLTSSGTVGTRFTEMVLTEQGHGLLWLAVPVQVTPTIYNGAALPVPRERSWLPIEKGGASNDGDIALWAACWFVTENEKTYCVPATTVVVGVKIRVPALFHAAVELKTETPV